MIAGRLSRYFGLRFLSAIVAVFAGAFALVAMIDFVEMLRRTGDIKDISAFFVAKITLLSRARSSPSGWCPSPCWSASMFCYLNLSRRLELVVARAAGVSAWQFIAPAVVIAMLIGAAMTTIYNPISATLREQSTRLEAELFGHDTSFRTTGSGFWLRQRGDDGQAVINAKIEPSAGHPAGRREHLPVRRVGPLPRPHRGQERHAGSRILAARRGALLRQRGAAGRPRHAIGSRPT